MAFTGYLRYTTGSTLYAKPLPLNDSAWTDDDVAGSENASLGSYSFASLTEGTEYEVFLQAGGSPANTDLAVGQLSYSDISGLATAANLATVDTVVDAIKAKTDLITTGAITVAATNRMVDTTMLLFIGEQHPFTIETDDYTAKTLEVAWETEDSATDVGSVANASITKATTSITFTIPAAVTTSSRNLRWSLRDTANADEVLMYGLCKVKATAHAD